MGIGPLGGIGMLRQNQELAPLPAWFEARRIVNQWRIPVLTPDDRPSQSAQFYSRILKADLSVGYSDSTFTSTHSHIARPLPGGYAQGITLDDFFASPPLDVGYLDRLNFKGLMFLEARGTTAFLAARSNADNMDVVEFTGSGWISTPIDYQAFAPWTGDMSVSPTVPCAYDSKRNVIVAPRPTQIGPFDFQVKHVEIDLNFNPPRYSEPPVSLNAGLWFDAPNANSLALVTSLTVGPLSVSESIGVFMFYSPIQDAVYLIGGTPAIISGGGPTLVSSPQRILKYKSGVWSDLSIRNTPRRRFLFPVGYDERLDRVVLASGIVSIDLLTGAVSTGSLEYATREWFLAKTQWVNSRPDAMQVAFVGNGNVLRPMDVLPGWFSPPGLLNMWFDPDHDLFHALQVNAGGTPSFDSISLAPNVFEDIPLPSGFTGIRAWFWPRLL